LNVVFIQSRTLTPEENDGANGCWKWK